MSKKKSIVSITLCLLLILSLFAGCSNGDTDSDDPGAKSSKSTLTVLTLPSGTGSYNESVAYTNILNKYTDYKVFMQSVSSSLAIPKGVQEGQAQVGHTILPIVSWAYNGDKDQGYDKPCPDLRVLMTGEDMAWSFVTYEGTGIKTVNDLKGKNVGWDFGVSSTMNTNASRLVLEAHGIDPVKDVKSIPQDSMVKPITDLMDKKIDAGYVSLNGSKIAEYASQVSPVYIPIDESAFEKIREKAPYFYPGKTLGDTEGVPAGIPVVTTPVLVYATTSMSEEDAYNVTKAIVESQEELIGMNAMFKYWTYVRPVNLPWHDGAIKYFKEVGLWTEEMDQEQANF